MNVSHLLNGESFHIERLMYIPLTKQQPLYLRPHTLVTDARSVNLIGERFEAAGTGHLTTNLINDISRTIIKPSTVAYETIINKGWMDQDRFVFILKVRHCGLGGDTITYLQGFTNCAEISTMGEVAHASHDLVHYISSVIETVEIVINTPMGPNRFEKLSKVYDVITDKTDEGVHLQRPSDIISNIKSFAVAQSVGKYGDLVDDEDFMRSVVNVGNKMNRYLERTETNKVENNISSLYLANVINAGIDDRKSKEYAYDSTSDFQASYDDYSNTETVLGSNRFISYLKSITGYRYAREEFTFNDLLAVDQYGANNFELGNPMPDTLQMAFNQTPHDGGGEYWNQQDPTTPVAYSIMQAAISLTAKYGFSMAVLHVDNRYTPMVDTCNVIISDSFSYLSVGPRDNQILLEMLRTRFFNEVFLVETNGGAMPIKADIYIDLLGDSKIYIEFGYEAGTWYTLPTVANNYSVPTIAKSLAQYNDTSRMFGNFIDKVKSVVDKDQIPQQVQPQEGIAMPQIYY